MRPNGLIWGLTLAGLSVLLLGCQSVRTRSTAAKPRAGVLAPTNSPSSSTSEAALRQRARALAHYGSGVIHDQNDETEAALDDYFLAATEDPGDDSLVLEVSRRLLQRKKFEKALEVVNRAAAKPKASGLIYARLGLIYAQLGREDEAIAASRTAIKKAPGLLQPYQNLFVLYVQKKQAKEALGVLDEAAAQPKPGPEFLLTLSELYASVGAQMPSEKEKARAKALAVLERVRKESPSAPQLQLMLAEQFYALGDTSAAAELYQELLKHSPESPMLRERVHARLSEIYLNAKDHKRAAEALEALARDNPTNPQVYYFLGSIALQQKETAKAVENLRKAILLKPEMEPAYYELANAQIILDKAGDALQTLEKARTNFGQSFIVEFLSGLAYGRQKDYTNAIRCYTAAEVVARATDPKRLNEFFYFQLGAAYERGGDFPQAEKYLRKSVEVAPDFAEALNYLGYMWADQGTNLQEAATFIGKALKAEPKNGAFLDSLGWVFFKQGRTKEALEQLLKALERLEEPDATVFDHLGDVYAALKQPEKAAEYWKKSLSIEASEKVKRKLEKREGEGPK